VDLKDLVLANRSYRRFDGARPVPPDALEQLASLARATPSAANRQPLKLVLSTAPDMNARIYDTLAWAAYLEDWPGPAPAERPTAYIVCLLDTAISKAADVDLGIVAQTMLLGAVEKGLGGCMFLNIRKESLAGVLGLPSHLAVALVIALGWPVERVVLEDLSAGGSIRYYREPDGTHHVPKRTLAELVHARYG
jgi:nitroreductase